MKRLSTKTHGKIDYIIGLILVSSPWIFDYAASYQYYIWIPFALGSFIILYSMLTDYEHGFSPVIGVKVNLVLDFLCGAFLAASPWIFNFHEILYLPHVVLGGLLVLNALLSRSEYVISIIDARTPEVRTTTGTIPEVRENVSTPAGQHNPQTLSGEQKSQEDNDEKREERTQI